MLLKKKQIAGLLVSIMMLSSCSDYLDLVPDDRLATIEYAFAMRSEAKKYLYTCYSYMPRNNRTTAPEFLGGDEYGLLLSSVATSSIFDGTFRIARGLQNAANPVDDDWEKMYQALRVCNVFLENVESVPDMINEEEREHWTGEVLFLKAFYHFHLVRKWGPVPIIRDNLPITADVDEVRVSRNTVDECFAHIVGLLDEAIPLLPLGVESPSQDLGRITRPIASAFKAKVLVYAASPLFNNNDDQSTLRNHDGTPLFATGLSAEEEIAKWNSAVTACREAILLCHETNHRLFEFPSASNWSDTIKREMNIRGSVTYKFSNTEQIWVNTQTTSDDINNIQLASMQNVDKDLYPDNYVISASLCPALKIVQQYHTSHGIPIEEDRDWQGVDLLALRAGDDAHLYYIRKDYTTVQQNFDREPRFYAHLGFDGGIWFRQKESVLGTDPGVYKHVENQPGKPRSPWDGYTGYYSKKLVHYEKMAANNAGSTTTADYLWPLMRL
ncbi:MAG: RagB/SusD family nutrient uptake outer membrane protein, partial [Tannerella sp.]|nr:RagB/SusD family nutrient uptake outer membrane protein [Tannerella sp.]